MGSDEEDHTTAVFAEEDLDEEDDDESEAEDHNLQNQHVDEEDVDMIDEEDDDEEVEVEEEDDSMSSAAGEVTIAVAGVPSVATTAAATPTTTTDAITTTNSVVQSDAIVEVKKPMPLDDSRRLFQRLWTDEDEIELLQGFLDYTTQRGTNNSSHHHHDTAAFYDQIKGKLQLDFNKNQLVEKLRRLKKKYRNVLSKISIGKEYIFKSPHDQATFDLSCKIWSGAAATPVSIPATDGGGIEDEEHHNPNLTTFNLNENNGNDIADPNSSEKKVSRPRKRSKSSAVKVEENYNQQQHCGQAAGVGASNPSNPGISNLVEETVKSCLLPLFKELVNNSPNGACGSSKGIGLGGMSMNHFGGPMNFAIGDMTDDKWRKQHILELEVYSKRLELMQDQIKSRLEELKSMGSS